jgi:hypothetical protein
VAQLYPQALGSLFVSSYDSQGYGADIKHQERVTLRLAVYRQSVRLGAKPLEVHDHTFSLQLNLAVIK